MKGKIDKGGNLLIERANQMKLQGCPVDTEDSYCGDWCPLFEEPKISQWMGSPDPDAPNRAKDPRPWDVRICKKTIFLDELVDERLT